MPSISHTMETQEVGSGMMADVCVVCGQEAQAYIETGGPQYPKTRFFGQPRLPNEDTNCRLVPFQDIKPAYFQVCEYAYIDECCVTTLVLPIDAYPTRIEMFRHGLAAVGFRNGTASVPVERHFILFRNALFKYYPDSAPSVRNVLRHWNLGLPWYEEATVFEVIPHGAENG